jgi:hypothetical protein
LLRNINLYEDVDMKIIVIGAAGLIGTKRWKDCVRMGMMLFRHREAQA